MINQLIKLLTEDFKFFLNLTIEHILISLLAISIASVLGIILGIIISEYRKFSGLILGTVNILYTIPSIALLGFFITITGVWEYNSTYCFNNICTFTNNKKYIHRNYNYKSLDYRGIRGNGKYKITTTIQS